MKEPSEYFFNLPQEVRLHLFSFFGTRESCRFAQVNKSLGNLLSDFRLKREYEIFIGPQNYPKCGYSLILDQQSLLVESANTYEKYCKILSLDNKCLQICEENTLYEVQAFSRFLARNGLVFSMSTMYSDSHINTKLKQLYEIDTSPEDTRLYYEILRYDISELKMVAAAFGMANIIQFFFPNIVNSGMLAKIIDLIENAYSLGEYLIAKPEYQIEDVYAKLNDKDRNACLELRAWSLANFSDNFNGFKRCIQYLLDKGIILDLSDNDRDGAVSYLSDRDSNISIHHFCTLYREFVPSQIQELFDLILDAAKLNDSQFNPDFGFNIEIDNTFFENHNKDMLPYNRGVKPHIIPSP